MQWSLRSLLIAAAVLTVAIFGLYQSTPTWVSVVTSVAGLLWIAIGVVAVASTDSRRTWARGVFVAATLYGILVFALGGELGLTGSRLATSQVLAWAFQFTPQHSFEIHPDSTYVTFSGVPNGRLNISGPMGNVNASRISFGQFAALRLWNPRQDFGTIGHTYWAILFGLLGGWFALFIERQRPREPAESSQT